MAVKSQVQTDKYSNILLAMVTETAANTLTYNQLPQVTTLMDKKAFLINRLEYQPGTGAVVAANDSLKWGLSLSDNIADPLLDEPQVIDYNYEVCIGASVEYRPYTRVKDYSTLPGGGLLVPSRAMFLFAKGGNLAAATTNYLKMYFTILDLSPADYWDLVEALQAYT